VGCKAVLKTLNTRIRESSQRLRLPNSHPHATRVCADMPGKCHLPELHLLPMQLYTTNTLCGARLCPTLADSDVAEQLEAQLNATLEQKAWLTVGIPTVPRKNGADYLTRTLDTLLQVETFKLP
jgi:hypothetical protein